MKARFSRGCRNVQATRDPRIRFFRGLVVGRSGFNFFPSSRFQNEFRNDQSIVSSLLFRTHEHDSLHLIRQLYDTTCFQVFSEHFFLSMLVSGSTLPFRFSTSQLFYFVSLSVVFSPARKVLSSVDELGADQHAQGGAVGE